MNNVKFMPWLSLKAARGLVEQVIGDDRNSAVDFLLSAASDITEASARIEKEIPEILADKMRSSLANTQVARKTISKITEPALKTANAAIDYATAAIDELTKKTDPKPPEDMMLAMQHAEVRSVLLRMSDIERRKAVQNAIKSGDETFLAAATSGAPMLSGMTAAEQSSAREQWRSSRHPDTAERIERLRKGLAQLERITPMLGKWSEQLVPEPSPATAEASATQAVS